jgi:hypothetical protein
MLRTGRFDPGDLLSCQASLDQHTVYPFAISDGIYQWLAAIDDIFAGFHFLSVIAC